MATRREFVSTGRQRTRLVRAVATGFALSISALCADTTASGQTQMTVVPIRAQVPAIEGWVQLADARLFYWDTGGDGPPTVLLHPATAAR